MTPTNGQMKNENHGDSMLLFAIVALVVIGVMMVFSASSVFAEEKKLDPLFFFKRHLVWVALGTFVFWIMRKIDPDLLKSLSLYILCLSFILLVLVLVPGAGKSANGAVRWISVGSLSFQPSEFAKFALILFLASSLDKRGERLSDFAYGYLPNLIVLGIFFVLILLQPDFGTAVILSAVSFIMFFIVGVRLKFLVVSCLAILPFLAIAMTGAKYRMDRIQGYLNPWQDEEGVGYQAVNSFLALGRGGIDGVGLGASQQNNLMFLPEAHTDFIFSVLGEELGFIGTMTVILLFCLLIWRGMVVAIYARKTFDTYLAIGLTLLVGVQALANMGVAVGILPITGMTLPFISHGGSSMLVMMMSVGVLMNISERSYPKR